MLDWDEIERQYSEYCRKTGEIRRAAKARMERKAKFYLALALVVAWLDACLEVLNG